MVPISMGAAALLGGTSIVSSLIGGLFGSSSTNSANAQNYKMFREQIDYDRWKFNEEKRYNSLPEQMRQYRAAGLNPALMMQGAGSSVSAGGSPTAPSAIPTDYAPYMQAGTQLASMLAQSTLMEKQGANLEQDTLLKSIDAQSKGLKNLYELKNLAQDFKKKGYDVKYLDRMIRGQELLNEYGEKSMADRLQLTSFEMETQKEQWRALALQNKYLDKYGDRQNQAAINQMVASTYAAYATGKASLQEAHQHLMEIFAKYGKSDKDRGDYFKATLEGLQQAKSESVSREYVNWSDQPIPGSGARWHANENRNDYLNEYKKR